MPRFTAVYRSCYTGNPFSLHATGCKNIRRDVRDNDGNTTEFEAESLAAALDVVIDDELRDMGYTHSSVDVHPCCKKGVK